MPSGHHSEHARRHLGGLVTVRAAAADTNGSLAVIEERASRGYTTPPHVHRREDETLFVIEGTVEYTIDGVTATVTAGAAAFLPRGVPHNFTVLSSAAHFLVIITPGGFERFFSEVSPPAAAEDQDHPDTDPVRMAASAAELGTTVLGTPEDRGEQALTAAQLAAASDTLAEITEAYRVIEHAVAGPGPLPSRLDALAERLTAVACARLSQHPAHARSLILLGILAERAERAERTPQALPIQVPRLLDAVRPDWPESTALAAAYLLAHFPEHAEAIEEALTTTVLDAPDLARLRRCLARPADLGGTEALNLLGRVWPSPATWMLDPAERDLDQRWRATLALTAEAAEELWLSETATLLAFMGAKAEHAVERAQSDA